jgi:hypothetical protein
VTPWTDSTAFGASSRPNIIFRILCFTFSLVPKRKTLTKTPTVTMVSCTSTGRVTPFLRSSDPPNLRSSDHPIIRTSDHPKLLVVVSESANHGIILRNHVATYRSEEYESTGKRIPEVVPRITGVCFRCSFLAGLSCYTSPSRPSISFPGIPVHLHTIMLNMRLLS